MRTIGTLVRATRKQLGLVQLPVAKRLDLTQSALSRIESGLQVMTAPQWAEFCSFTGISPECIMTGYIEFMRPAALESVKQKIPFRMPAKYLDDRGTKVRATLPITKFFKSIYGLDGFEKYCESNKIDPDFFVNLDNQIHVDFSFDMVDFLRLKGHLKTADIVKMTKPVNRPEMHGQLRHMYEGLKSNVTQLISAFASHSLYYDCNFKYGIADTARKHIDFFIRPEAHVWEKLRNTNSDTAEFISKYRKHYGERFAAFGSDHIPQVEHRESFFKGAEQCVFRVEWAQ